MTTARRRERRAPGKYYRSRGGTYAKVTLMTKRSERGEKLYRMHYRCGGFLVRSSQAWTLAEIEDSGGRWLSRRPSGWADLVTPSQARRRELAQP